MVELTYRLSKEWAHSWAGIDLAHADETALRYKAFLGDLFFTINGADFNAPWGWIPILDFALAFSDIVDELARGATESSFEFTESDECLFFVNHGKSVIVSCSYNQQRAVIPLANLIEAGKSLTQRIYDEQSQAHPELLDNELFVKWLNRAANAM